MPKSLTDRQAIFANPDLTTTQGQREARRMGKQSRVRHEQMEHLRAWRDNLGLSRQAVVNRIGTLVPGAPSVDQATLEKWETGKTAVRVEDLKLLAEVYGTSPDRLFFAPNDKATPERMGRAFKVLAEADPEAVERWLALGETLRSSEK